MRQCRGGIQEPHPFLQLLTLAERGYLLRCMSSFHPYKYPTQVIMLVFFFLSVELVMRPRKLRNLGKNAQLVTGRADIQAPILWL